jgi:bifunctional ADP-heptose synthase (sugar kinase/adenylyltransferase)
MYKVLVIGEQCIDVFVYGKVERLSPEGPAPVFQPTKTITNGGMAENVFNNLVSLGIDTYSYYNTDIQIRKTRYVDESFNHLFLRVDENDRCERIDVSKLPNLSQFSAVILSDYNKGFLDFSDIEYISERHPLVILDTKKELGEWAKSVKFIKLNRGEYERNKGYATHNDWIEEKLIITLDKGGAKYRDVVYPTPFVEVLDVSGAGDTFVAGFAYKYLETKDVGDAIKFANECSLRVIQRRGVGVINK